MKKPCIAYVGGVIVGGSAATLSFTTRHRPDPWWSLGLFTAFGLHLLGYWLVVHYLTENL